MLSSIKVVCNFEVIRTELTYLSPGYHDRDLQTALLAQVERILFSTKVTKIAQANFGHHAANAMSPPSGYQEERMEVTKLQSLEDGDSIYEDADVEPNISSKHRFHVKKNPGNAKIDNAIIGETVSSPVVSSSSPGGIDFNLDLLELEIQILESCECHY